MSPAASLHDVSLADGLFDNLALRDNRFFHGVGDRVDAVVPVRVKAFRMLPFQPVNARPEINVLVAVRDLLARVEQSEDDGVRTDGSSEDSDGPSRRFLANVDGLERATVLDALGERFSAAVDVAGIV